MIPRAASDDPASGRRAPQWREGSTLVEPFGSMMGPGLKMLAAIVTSGLFGARRLRTDRVPAPVNVYVKVADRPNGAGSPSFVLGSISVCRRPRNRPSATRTGNPTAMTKMTLPTARKLS